MPGVEPRSQRGLIDPKLVGRRFDVAVRPHQGVGDSVRVRKEVARSSGSHVGLRGFVLASMVTAAQVFELVRQSASPFDLPELPIEPDPRVAVTNPPHPRTEVDVMNDDVRESAKVAPRVRQVHATRR